MPWGQLVAQVDPTGIAGWVAAIGTAGLTGPILYWLLYKHLPAKDQQLKDYLAVKDAQLAAKDVQIVDIANRKDAQLALMVENHTKTVQAVIEHCRLEAGKEREASERRHAEAVAMLQRLHDAAREAIHTTRNMENVLRIRSRLADALQSTELAAWTKTLDGSLMSWNAAAERLLGWQAGEIVGQSVYARLIPADFRDQERDVLRRISAGEAVGEYHTDRLTKDGRRVALTVVASPIKDQTGRVVGASTIVRES